MAHSGSSGLGSCLVDWGHHLEDWQSIIVVSLVLGILNTLLKPLLVTLSLPITILTLGLFLIVINAALLLLVEWIVDAFTDFQFSIDGFWNAVLGAIIISIVTFIVNRFIDTKKISRSLSHR